MILEVFKCEESVNLAHYFPYDVKLRLLAHSRSFLANQKARNAIVGAENLLSIDRDIDGVLTEMSFHCQLRVSIDTWLQMPLVHMIPETFLTLFC